MSEQAVTSNHVIIEQPPTRPNSRGRWELVLSHRDRLLGIARRKLQHDYEAEDCVHDALVRCVMFERLDDRRVGEFLTVTLVRLCLDHRRRLVRRSRLLPRAFPETKAPDLEALLCDRAIGRRIVQAAAELRGRERQIMLARAKGLSTAHAAAQLGISLKAAEGAFTRGRARLQALCADTN